MTVFQWKVVPKWTIKGYPDYVFGEDKKLYNHKTGKMLPVKIKGGYTRGYNLKGKFHSLDKIKPLLERYVEPDCPF